MSKLKPFFFALLGFFAAVGVLSFAHVGPASAQSPGVNLAQLAATVSSLQSTVTNLQSTVTNLQSTVTSQGSTITSQAAKIAALQAKTSAASMSRSSTAWAARKPLTASAT